MTDNDIQRINLSEVQISFSGITDLATIYPEIALDWDEAKNGGTPASCGDTPFGR